MLGTRGSSLLLAAGAAIVLAGCGGGGGATSLASVGENVLNFGQVQVRAVGGVQTPVTMLGDRSTITGVFGANFTNVSVSLPPATALNPDVLLSSTLLGASVGGRPILFDYGTGAIYNVNPATPTNIVNSTPSFTGSGSSVVSSEFDAPTGQAQLFITNIDGSGRTKITSGSSSSLEPSSSPTSSQIVFIRDSDVYVINRDGSGLTRLTTSPTLAKKSPKFNPAGTKIAFLEQNPSYQVYEMNANGQALLQKTSFGDPVSFFDYSPTGSDIALSSTGAGGASLYTFSFDAGSSKLLYSAPTGDAIGAVTWSPDGSQIAFIHTVSANDVRLDGVRLASNDGPSTLHFFGNTVVDSLEWGPIVSKRTFIAVSGGSLNTNAAGFLFGMSGQEFRSLLAFDAVTRNTVAIDVPNASSPTASNHVATITSADSINMLRYANSISAPSVTVVDPSKPATFIQGAIVSFDAGTGRVAFVIPFTRSRAEGKPSRVDKGGLVTVQGHFTGIWDGQGKQTAPNGATEVTLDGHSGKVIQFR